MKKVYWIVILLLVAQHWAVAQGQRFLEPVFSEVRCDVGIPYATALAIGSEDEETLYFDFYEPVGDTMTYRPLVITVFGGAFVAGNRSWCDMQAFADSLCRYGYVVASIDYRLLSAWRVSETNFIRNAYGAAQDVSAAVRFFKGNRETYRVDSAQIFVLGNSAGTIAAMHTIWMDDNERPPETYEDDGFLGIGGHCDLGNIHTSGYDQYLDYSADIAGLIAQWGGVLDTNIISSDDRTPVCLIHGTADETVPFYSAAPYEGKIGLTSLMLPEMYGSYYLDRRLSSLGIEHEMHIFEGEEHCFYLEGTSTLLPEKLDTCFRIALHFMARYNRHLQAPDVVCENAALEFVVSPNPAIDFIQVSMNQEDVPFTCALYNSNGLKVMSCDNCDRLELSGLPVGLYELVVHSARGHHTEKIIHLSR